MGFGAAYIRDLTVDLPELIVDEYSTVVALGMNLSYVDGWTWDVNKYPPANACLTIFSVAVIKLSVWPVVPMVPFRPTWLAVLSDVIGVATHDVRRSQPHRKRFLLPVIASCSSERPNILLIALRLLIHTLWVLDSVQVISITAISFQLIGLETSGSLSLTWFNWVYGKNK